MRKLTTDREELPDRPKNDVISYMVVASFNGVECRCSSESTAAAFLTKPAI